MRFTYYLLWLSGFYVTSIHPSGLSAKAHGCVRLVAPLFLLRRFGEDCARTSLARHGRLLALVAAQIEAGGVG